MSTLSLPFMIILYETGQFSSEVIAMKQSPKKQNPMRPDEAEKPISDAYPVIDTDLARDNLENDLPAADLEDL